LAVLAQLGLGPRIAALGQRIDRLFGRVCPSQKMVLDVRYSSLGSGSFAIAVHRAALFRVLYDAVLLEAVPVETGARIDGVEDAGGAGIRLVRGGATTEPFDLIVDALGSRTALGPLLGAPSREDLAYGALWANLPWPANGFDAHCLEQRYERAHTMAGVLPIGRPHEQAGALAAFFWSLKPAHYAAWREAGLAAWKTRVQRLWPETAPLLEHISAPEALTFARYTHHTLARPWRDRIVAIGDAAHAASPQLGQGANMGLLDAYALSVALSEAGDLRRALPLYARLRRWHVRFYQALSVGFTPFYQSDSTALPFWRDRLVAPATRWPGIVRLVAAAVAGTFFDPRPRLGLSGSRVDQPGAAEADLVG
jgi:2-polyprenyl-6-methoxyphenol hydroxylase-like FAD-dependent oxidoreductase